MVATRPTGRTPHELVEVSPERCPDCGADLRPRRTTRVGWATRPGDGVMARYWRCVACDRMIWSND